MKHALAVVIALFSIACSQTTNGGDAGDGSMHDAANDVAIVCHSDRDCSAAGLVCDDVRSLCVQCNGAADCGDAGTACIANNCRQITPCTTSRICPAQVCDMVLGYCVDCVANADCTTGQMCQSSVCVAAALPCDRLANAAR